MSQSATNPTDAPSRISIRPAAREDIPFILQMVHELAVYEENEDAVEATPELFTRWLFDQPLAECLIGSVDGIDRGIALFFLNFSTWTGRPGIYLEDLYVQPEVRGSGLGKALLKELACIAIQRDYGRIEWSCLDWNEPSLAFYRSLGATTMDGWITHRMDKTTFAAFAQS